MEAYAIKIYSDVRKLLNKWKKDGKIFLINLPSKWFLKKSWMLIKNGKNWARVITAINNFIGLQVNGFQRISLLFILSSNSIFYYFSIYPTYIRTPVSKTNQIRDISAELWTKLEILGNSLYFSIFAFVLPKSEKNWIRWKKLGKLEKLRKLE